MTVATVEPSFPTRHSAPGPTAVTPVQPPRGTPLDLDGVRDLSVRAAVARMNVDLTGGAGQTVLLAVGSTVVSLGAPAAGAVLAAALATAGQAVLGRRVAASERAAVEEASSPAYDAARDVAAVLGVPTRDVCRAAGIALRTYYSWRNGATPRLGSQGLLWKLVQGSEDLVEVHARAAPSRTGSGRNPGDEPRCAAATWTRSSRRPCRQ